MLAKQALDEGLEIFAGLGKGEGAGGFGPVELIAGGEGGDPDLADGSVGRDDELAGAVPEDDVHDAVVVLELEGTVGIVFGGDEGLLEGFEGVVGVAAEGGFVEHEVSVSQRLESAREAHQASRCIRQKNGRPMKSGRLS